tara:strand:+ start:327 stop:650 length:324 start_codon:yes stop_codon:yes gene_type:complete
MTIDETEFETLAEEVLQRVCRAIEDVSDDVDVDLQGGVLTVELEDGRIFLLNKHAPMRQLWLSSPISGAMHFYYADGYWPSTRGARELAATLIDDFGRVGLPIDLDT